MTTSKRPEVVQRFRQEARSASRIGHENIVDVTDFGQLDEGGVYFVMEHLKGESLSEVIRGRTLEITRAAPIIMQIARALQAAHKLGIVHRDMKPENIFLVERDDIRDFVKILDFGIAKISDRDTDGKRLTKTGMIFGTPEYMSPEQAAGKHLDHRVDIYALGCIMFEMFTGRVPYDGDSFMAVLTQHMFEPIPPIEEIVPDTDVPDSVRSVVYKAMSKECDNRYSDMAALQLDLERALVDTGYLAESSSGREISSVVHLESMLQNAREREKRKEPSTETEWQKKNTGSVEKRSSKFALTIMVLAVFIIGGGAGAAYFLEMFGNGAKNNGNTIKAMAGRIVGAEVSQDTLSAAAEQGGKIDSEVAVNDESGNLLPQEEPLEFKQEETPKIAVAVKTIPPEAVISVEGLGQVCSKSPCVIDLDDGTTFEIQARIDNTEAKMEFTPSPQNKEIVIELKQEKETPRPKRKPGKTKSQNGTRKKKKNKVNNGLKIPGIFQDG